MSHLLKKINFTGKNKAKILVVGDIILDKYITGKIRGISPEAPVPIVDVEGEYFSLGGCSNVAANIKSLIPDIKVDICGMISNDFGGLEIRRLLDKAKINHDNMFFTEKHPTILKTRIVSDNKQLIRFDIEHKNNVDNQDRAKIVTRLNKIACNYDIIVVSDYNKGFVCDKIMDTLRISKEKAKIIVDPKKKDFSIYKNVDFITPNKREFETAMNIQVEDIEHAKRLSREMLERYSIKNIVLTLSENGILFTNSDISDNYDAIHKEVVDVCGAGDIVVAALAAFLANKIDIEDSIYLANIAAGISVLKFGTCTVTIDEIRNLIKNELNKENN
jgi:D-beta-D-heptose 7-phosphate kinase/D-beta-D-heptose 1-phosphate adenosyltransferase